MLELLALAIAPALFILLYIWKKDRYEPEPLHLITWVFFLGALSTIPALILEYPFPEGVFSSAVIAPVAEELVKFSVVFLVMYRHPEFDEPMDGIVYATAASLGFATVENILYVLEGGIGVGILRALMSVPGHVIFSCIWGFALGMAKFPPESSRVRIIFTGLFGAMLLHGIYNFSIEVLGVLALLVILVVIIPSGWWFTVRNIKKAHADPGSACSAMKNSGPGYLSYPSLMVISHPGPALPQPIPDEHPNKETVPVQQSAVSGFCTACRTPYRQGTRFCENCGKKI